MALSHGRNQTGNYESAAFFIRHDLHNREFLFFGDVEPDTVAPRPQTIDVWRVAAPKIPQKLSTIFIECSWPSGRHRDVLYGHLSPEYLVDELTALALEIVKFKNSGPTGIRPGPPRKKQKKNPISQDDLRGTLDGVKVYIIHCKDDLTGDSIRSMRHVIVSQVRGLMEEKGLGAQILAAEPGMHISTFSQVAYSWMLSNIQCQRYSSSCTYSGLLGPPCTNSGFEMLLMRSVVYLVFVALVFSLGLVD